MDSRVWGGALLVSGTAIGAGVLAVPVLTSEAGFLSSSFLYVLAWLFSILTGFCLLESIVLCGYHRRVNILSLAEVSFGRVAGMMVGIGYLCLFYALMTAYFCEGGNILASMLSRSKMELDEHLFPFIFGVLVCPIFFAKTAVIDRINRIFMYGLGLSFVGFCVLCVPHLRLDYLLRTDVKHVMSGLPILFLSFGYQNIIPTLYYYMGEDVQKTKLAIILGTLLPLVLYVIWEGLALGIVDVAQLQTARCWGHTALEALQHALHSSHIYVVGQVFGVCALVSSFIGVGLGVGDFLSDGLGWKKEKHIGVIFLLTFLLPLVLSMTYPQMVLVCLQYAGGLGVSILIGLLPLMILWYLRYIAKIPYKKKKIFKGDKISLLVLFSFIVLDIWILFYSV